MLEEQVIQQLKEQHEEIKQTNSKIEAMMIKLINQEEALGDLRQEMATKPDMQKVLLGQDKIALELKKLNEERYSSLDLIRRIEDELETQKHRIDGHDDLVQKAKSQLGIN